jgi:predicted ArsR family transcriptional regulator
MTGDLFGWTAPPPAARYPEVPGARRRDTSQSAAEAIAPSVHRLRDLVLEQFRRHGAMTADEVAAKTGIHFLTARPRVSELLKLGMLVPTNERRRSTGGGRPAIVWRATTSNELSATGTAGP